MRILGVDPGSLITGWGLLDRQGSRCTLIEGGTIRLASRGLSFPRRLGDLQNELQGLVERLRPGCAAVESPFHGANARSSLQLAHARGVILAVLSSSGVQVAEYSPATVKKSITGNGRATKEQVEAMVGHLLGRDGPLPRSGDLADALAVALCHATSSRYEARVSRATAMSATRRATRIPR